MQNYFFPEKVAWKLGISNSTSIFEHISKSTRAKIKKSLKIYKELGYSFEFEEITEKNIDLFVNIYTQNILSKKNPKIFNIKEYLDDHAAKDKEYVHLCAYKNDIYIGGCILAIKKDIINFAFKVFPLEDKGGDLNLTLLVEYFVFEKALELNKNYIFHGADSNLYGEHSNIGLAMFKLSLGHYPFISSSKDNKINKYIWSGDKDVFGFTCEENSQPGDELTTGVLFIADNLSDDEVGDKYGVLLKNSKISVKCIKKLNQ